jgi:hypothetical protein
MVDLIMLLFFCKKGIASFQFEGQLIRTSRRQVFNFKLDSLVRSTVDEVWPLLGLKQLRSNFCPVFCFAHH